MLYKRPESIDETDLLQRILQRMADLFAEFRIKHPEKSVLTNQAAGEEIWTLKKTFFR